ncbi:DNA-binding protein [Streptomyces tubercidicus]|uniref:helix-turn-helix transcriptional regulator n=1 Tax=Streptomyces tubercidicus TaxID=47759 RepID=UPI002E150292|nr:helix-turn-helix domain-containing protein [Streptomyces tubercidicus]
MTEGPALTAIRNDASTPPQSPDALLTPAQVSAWTQLDEQTLANARWRRTGPTYIKLGTGRSAPVRYRRLDVEKWLAAQTVEAA